MDFHVCMDFHGFSWIFMDFHGFSWIFMDFHEFSWIFMDFHVCKSPGLRFVSPRAAAKGSQNVCKSPGLRFVSPRAAVCKSPGCKTSIIRHGFSWIFNGFSMDFPWIFMDSHGFSWIFINLVHSLSFTQLANPSFLFTRWWPPVNIPVAAFIQSSHE